MSNLNLLHESERVLVIYRIYRWDYVMAEYKCVAGYRDQPEALRAYADELEKDPMPDGNIKLTKETTEIIMTTEVEG